MERDRMACEAQSGDEVGVTASSLQRCLSDRNTELCHRPLIPYSTTVGLPVGEKNEAATPFPSLRITPEAFQRPSRSFVLWQP